MELARKIGVKSLVFLMGISALSYIMDGLMEA